MSMSATRALPVLLNDLCIERVDVRPEPAGGSAAKLDGRRKFSFPDPPPDGESRNSVVVGNLDIGAIHDRYSCVFDDTTMLERCKTVRACLIAEILQFDGNRRLFALTYL